MSSKFTSGKHAISECDRCGQQYKLKALKELIVRTRRTNVMVCPTCWDGDHPQNMQGMYPVEDPQALRNPRPDRSYVASGPLANGNQGEGSRNIQWGWNPVGGSRFFDDALTPNRLALGVQIGIITVTIS